MKIKSEREHERKKSQNQSITPTEAQLSSVPCSMNYKNDPNGPKFLQLLSFSLRASDSNVVLKSNQ